MTAKEIADLERGNLKTIILLREGIFWKAYEKSAYAFSRQVQPYKLTKKYVKAIHGELVSLGFPMSAATTVLAGQKILLQDEHKQVIESGEVNETEFTQWKEKLPLANTALPSVQSSVQSVALPLIQPPTLLLAEEIVARIRQFNLESKTPVECMLFLATIKGQLSNPEKIETYG